MVVERRWTLDDRAESVWHSVPVEVGAGCEGISVLLDVRGDAGVVVDLGCEGAAGWRGWSGGARREFAITPMSATPGYVPGELEPGEWSVVIGLHRIPVDGVDVRVEVVTGPVAEVPGRAAYDHATATATATATAAGAAARAAGAGRRARRELPAPGVMRWVACDFHTHSLHSDGSESVAGVAALGVRAGLDLVAITDHNTVAHHAELPTIAKRLGIGLLAGQEVTTESGHANAFGEIGWIDFRRPAAYWLEEVERRGGVMSVNHPLSADCCWRQPLRDKPPLAEVWHETWLDRHWSGPIAWWQAWGLGTAPIGGSDWHGPHSMAVPGSPTTWVCVDAEASGPDELPLAVLQGLRERRTAVSADRDAPVLLGVDDELVVVDGEGALVVRPDGGRIPVRSDRERIPAVDSGGHVLIAHDGEVLSLAAGAVTS